LSPFGRPTRGATLVGLLAACAPLLWPAAAPAASSKPGVVRRPPIVWRPIPFPSARKAEMAAYAERNYGIDTWRLRDPRVIVEHYTANESFQATWNTFAANTPDPSPRRASRRLRPLRHRDRRDDLRARLARDDVPPHRRA
jgi:hypothetical protein